MHCPFCYAEDTKVVDSRLVAQGEQVRRRRECLACQQRFTTFETVELLLPLIIKRDGRRETFILDKLRSGMQQALQKDQLALIYWMKLKPTFYKKFVVMESER